MAEPQSWILWSHQERGRGDLAKNQAQGFSIGCPKDERELPDWQEDDHFHPTDGNSSLSKKPCVRSKLVEMEAMQRGRSIMLVTAQIACPNPSSSGT